MAANRNNINKIEPPFRKIRGYAFDPSASLDLDVAGVNQIVYTIPWESDLKPGPEGSYIKVIDRDPASGTIYKPVDLNDPNLIATDGLSPSETNPQFHQQMTYAVIMNTIKNFEKALGRKVTWSPVEKYIGNKRVFEFVEKLLVYPHALREQNAYYSPDRKALLFGYFNATPVSAGVFMPDGIVYSCLSHDIIAHETTHALLDGMYSRFMECTNPDVYAFHEGFSDIVALLQHFTYPEILKNEIRKVRGELDSENLLAKLAVEFGQSSGSHKSLRDAIGTTNKKGVWEKRKPATSDYENEDNFECHDRGAMLVATVFDAFIAIYKRRIADLIRIATGGSGVLPAGDLHPDLVNKLATEAARVASHVLNMCVRALDYCPPVDLTYGDYLRALITADTELVTNDDQNYRLAFINAFKKRGIFPENVPNLSVETLSYNYTENKTEKEWFSNEMISFFREFKEKLSYVTDRKDIFDLTTAFIRGDDSKNIRGLHSYLFEEERSEQNAIKFENLTGLVFTDSYKKLGIGTSRTYKNKRPSIEIHSLRIHNRVGPDGNIQNQIILTLSQRCKVVVDENKKTHKVTFRPYAGKKDIDKPNFIFRGGCTLIFDLNDLKLKHVIKKPIFNPTTKKTANRILHLNQKRLNMQYSCYFGRLKDKMGFAPHQNEPFEFIHKSKNVNHGW